MKSFPRVIEVPRNYAKTLARRAAHGKRDSDSKICQGYERDEEQSVLHK